MSKAYRAFVGPGMCDINGHMNVMFYTQHFDAACWTLLQNLAGETAGAHLGWADVKHETLFINEVPMSTFIIVTGRIERIGTKSLVTAMDMRVENDVQLAAQVKVTSVRFDLKARNAVPIEADLRARVEAILASQPPK